MDLDVRSLLRWDGACPDPRDTPGAPTKLRARAEVAELGTELAELQEKLFAQGQLGGSKRVLLLLQGMDASGKDGAVKHVVGLVNPAGVRITSFGQPTPQELTHPFLWRMDNALPTAGQIGVFNRSQYEDVLVVRVHDLVPRTVWSRRYAQINAWEKRLTASGCTIVKVFLHLSPAEQRSRLLERLDDPTKHWKVGPADVTERHRWADYQTAYDAVLAKTSTEVAPWYVLPADRKWYRDWALTHLLLETLRGMDLRWPEPIDLDLDGMRATLLDEPA